MESFFLSETVKYLYLLFSNASALVDHFVLSTEVGHGGMPLSGPVWGGWVVGVVCVFVCVGARAGGFPAVDHALRASCRVGGSRQVRQVDVGMRGACSEGILH
jgi:hypothetical protein